MRFFKDIAEPSFKLISYVVLILMLMYVLTPLVWLFITAFSIKGSPYLEIPEKWTISNFIEIFTGKVKGGTGTAAHPVYMGRWIANSLVISLSTMGLTVLLSAPAGYALSRLKFKGKDLLMTAILLIGFMPAMAKILPLLRLAATLKLTNNLLGVAMVVSSGTIPVNIWIIKGFFDQVPRELEEQAWICGCDRFTALFKVVLPAVGPGLAVVAFLSFLSGWGNFTIPLVMIQSEDLYPISLGIASVFIHNPGEIGLAIDYGFAAALSIIYMIPCLAVYYVFREHIMKIRLMKVEVR